MGPGGGEPERRGSPDGRSPEFARQEAGGGQVQHAFSFAGWFDEMMCGGSRGCPCGTREMDSAKISIDRSSSLWTEVIGEGEPCGVGITFRFNAFLQRFEVSSLIPRGPAFLSGEVKEGDVLMRADATDTTAIPLPELARLLIGTEGSRVTLHLKRPLTPPDDRGPIEDPASYKDVPVVLTRRPVEALLETQASPSLRKPAYSAQERDGSPWGGTSAPAASRPQAPQFRKSFVGVKDAGWTR